MTYLNEILNFTDYKIVDASSSDDLMIIVKNLIKDKWKIVGGVFINQNIYYQTMVKYGDNE